MPEHAPHDHAIKLVEGKQPPWGPIYSLSEEELAVLRAYIDQHIKTGFIRPSQSPAGAPILFVKKPRGGLRLCVDYRGLNNATIKNRYPLPLVGESLDRLGRAKRYTQLDLTAAYHRMRIRKGDEWKTAFRTRYGHFEYQVLPFGLANAPASFQAYINRALAQRLDVNVIVYLDDILVFSEDEATHEGDVKWVLEQLRKFKLYVCLDKCKFHTTEVRFLGYIISPEGISMQQDKVDSIRNWPTPKSINDIQQFIGLANFYRRFIQNFSRIAAPLTSMLKGSAEAYKKGKRKRRAKQSPSPGAPDHRQEEFLTSEAKTAFEALKACFLEKPLLHHFDPACKLRVETDASGKAIGGILTQLVGPEWHPIAYFS